MTYAQARAVLARLTVRAVKPGLSRTRRLLARLGRPDLACPAVQITGTNGKGSVAAMLAAVLEAAGLPAGQYLSPHLGGDRERVRLRGRPLAPAAFVRAVRELRPALAELRRRGDPATTFEAWTVLAALACARAGAKLVVLEAGMGGRLDATSAWGPIVLSVLTHVSRDHIRQLGNTVEAICREKAAVMRPGVPFLSAEPRPRLRAYLRRLARERRAPLAFAGRDAACAARILAWSRRPNGIRLSLFLGGLRRELEVGLRGAFQAENAALAVLAADALNRLGYAVPDRALREGLRRADWPGRLELVARRPAVWLDGAHNSAAAAALAREILETAGRAQWLVGVMADKDVPGICRALSPAVDRVWTLRPPDARALPARALAEEFGKQGVAAEPGGSWTRALGAARNRAGSRGTVVVAGSLYNIEPARRALRRLGAAGAGTQNRGKVDRA